MAWRPGEKGRFSPAPTCQPHLTDVVSVNQYSQYFPSLLAISYIAMIYRWRNHATIFRVSRHNLKLYRHNIAAYPRPLRYMTLTVLRTNIIRYTVRRAILILSKICFYVTTTPLVTVSALQQQQRTRWNTTHKSYQLLRWFYHIHQHNITIPLLTGTGPLSKPDVRILPAGCSQVADADGLGRWSPAAWQRWLAAGQELASTVPFIACMSVPLPRCFAGARVRLANRGVRVYPYPRVWVGYGYEVHGYGYTRFYP